MILAYQEPPAPARQRMTSTAPRLTIGLPVYNGAELLAAAIDALLGQSYSDFELVISDNASTDSTADICRDYEARDSRVRYIRQPQNLGLVRNHNYLVGIARGELFKWASHDDLYASDYLKRCVEALDAHPGAVLAHSWWVLVDPSGEPLQLFKNQVTAASPRAPERFRAMLFDGKGDWVYSVIRTAALRQTPLHATYYGGERTLIAELALHGALWQVPDALYFRRDHPNRELAPAEWSAVWDPSRTGRLRNPAIRLYAEYVRGYLSAIGRASLSPRDRRACYRLLASWLASRVVPEATPDGRPESFSNQPLLYLSRRAVGLVARRRGSRERAGACSIADPVGISVAALVAGKVADRA